MSRAKNPVDLHVGQRTQLARALAGLELEELAEALKVTPDQMQAYEAGERMDLATLFTIAKILKRPMAYFFDGLPSV